MLSDGAQRDACAEFFSLKGCDVHVAPDAAAARSLVRFSAYDVIVTDSEDGETRELLSAARRRNESVLPILLATSPRGEVDPRAIVLTKPFALGVILELAHDRPRRSPASA